MFENIIIPKDEMTPKERMIAFSKGHSIDRVPCCPFVGESFANHFGYGLDEFNHSQEIIVDTVVSTFRRFGSDNCSIGPGLHGMPEAMGCQLDFFEKDIPKIKSSPLKTYGDFDKLKRVNVYKDGRLNLYIESLKRIQDTVGHEVCVGNTLGGPFTTAGLVIGVDKLLRDLVRDKANVHRVIQLALENTLDMIDAITDLGITPGLADPLASSHLISKGTYNEFVLPYAKACQDRIKSRMNEGGVLHICGKTKPIWASMIKTGISGISLDNCDDIGELRSSFEDEITIIGNVDPVSALFLGKQDEVYKSVKECCVAGIGAKSGFVLATGCDVPIATKPERIDDFINAARIYGNLR